VRRIPRGKQNRGAKRAENQSLRRRLWFGPGTVLALLIGGAALAMQQSQLSNRPQASAAPGGRIAFAANASGRLQPADPTARLPTPARPLWKPEVGLLTKHGIELNLTPKQMTAMGNLDRQWRSDKAALEASLRDATADTASTLDQTTPNHGTQLRTIQSGLGDYSRTSREYDARRADYWFRAVALLNRSQHTIIDQWARTGGPERSAQ
jgi:hypothetical protein